MQTHYAESEGVESQGDVDQNPESQTLTGGAYAGADIRRDSREAQGVEVEHALEVAEVEESTDAHASVAVVKEDRAILIELGAKVDDIGEYEANALRLAHMPARRAFVDAQVITNHREAILERNHGVALVTAAVVLVTLKELGVVPNDYPPNPVGDALGKGHYGNGLNLPSVSLNGKTYYDLSYIGRDIEAKAARTAWLKANKGKLRSILLRK